MEATLNMTPHVPKRHSLMSYASPRPRPHPNLPALPPNPYHGPHVSNLAFLSGGAWQPLKERRNKIGDGVEGKPWATPPNPDTHLQARGTDLPNEAPNPIIAFLAE